MRVHVIIGTVFVFIEVNIILGACRGNLAWQQMWIESTTIGRHQHQHPRVLISASNSHLLLHFSVHVLNGPKQVSLSNISVSIRSRNLPMHVVLDNVLLQTLARLFQLSSQRRDFAPERLFQ